MSAKACAVLLLPLYVLLHTGLAGEHLSHLEPVLRIFGTNAVVKSISLPILEVDKETIRKSDNQHWTSDSATILIVSLKDSTIGFVVVDDVKGKDQLITYLLAVTPDLIVKDLEILAYREPYGGEVRYKSWQKQFFGKGPADQLRPGREIKNISGATISVRAITFGVRRILSMLNVVKERLLRTERTEK